MRLVTRLGDATRTAWRCSCRPRPTVLGEAIAAHHGMVAQYLGDGLLTFFGAKEASESDPERAIRAALAGRMAIATAFSDEKVHLRAGSTAG
jgi:class 3 adenylate cyclase